eukprot:scpid32153/ scgid21815/ Centromere protein I; FSH primary response protein 1; Follicle-stimulating hormone primary response protein; Interphase centromere complex protein 19; Leucine-rich primary response protein 1
MDSSELLSYFASPTVITEQKTRQCLARLKKHSQSHGLSNQECLQLIQAASSSRFDPQVSCQLVQCLLPAEVVSASCVYFTISVLSSDIACQDAQVLLLEWLVQIHPYIRMDHIFAQLYNVMVHLLKQSHLITPVCHLLYQVTQYTDVTPYRVSVLLALRQQQKDSDPELDAITAVLYVYQLHCPHLVPVDLEVSDDKVWRLFTLSESQRSCAAAISSMQMRAVVATGNSHPEGNGSIASNQVHEGETPGKKRKHGDLIARTPSGHSSLPTPTLTGDGAMANLADQPGPRQTLEFFRSFAASKIADDVDVAALDKHLVLYLLASGVDVVARLRLCTRLHTILWSEILHQRSWTTERVCHVKRVLSAVALVTEFLGEPLPVVEEFLQEYLTTWDGSMFF